MSSPLAQRFREFADAFSSLPLYSRLARAAADDELALRLLQNGQPGQRRPVLLLAALHELVTRRPQLPASRWFVQPELAATGDPWPDVRCALADFEDELRARIATSSVQTNEVNRSVYLAAMLSLQPTKPTLLIELGASAGLLLGVDQYRIEVAGPAGRQILGNDASSVICSGHVNQRLGHLPPIVNRLGIDLEPKSVWDEQDMSWLRACIWPEVPGRLARFDAAVAQLREAGAPRLIKGDLIEALPQALADPGDAEKAVVFTSWSLTYVERSRRADLIAAVRAAQVPTTLLTAEPDGAVPGIAIVNSPDTVLGEQRAGTARVLGTCHPHGEWVQIL